MIENATQYEITKTRVDKFELALAQLEKDSDSLLAQDNPRIWEATKEAIKSILEELTEQLVEYELRNKEWEN